MLLSDKMKTFLLELDNRERIFSRVSRKAVDCSVLDRILGERGLYKDRRRVGLFLENSTSTQRDSKMRSLKIEYSSTILNLRFLLI